MSAASADRNDTRITYLPLSDPRCNGFVCLAFKAAGDASQREIPFASQFIYGHYTVCYYSAFIVFFGILYLHRRLSAVYVVYPEPSTTILQKCRALWRCIKYRKLGNGMSMGHAITIGLVILVMVILTFVQKPYFRPRLSYGSPPLGVRTGVMALALTPAIVALSGRYNLITLVIGVSYERMNVLHRYLGYVCLGLGIVHSVTFAIAIYTDSNYWPLLEKIGSAEVSCSLDTDLVVTYSHGQQYTGVAVLFLLSFLTIFSIPWFRQRFYEAFAFSHILVYFLYLGFMFWHTANRIDTWMYLYATVAISLISNLSRILLKFKTPRWSGSTATIQDIDGEMLRITIPAFNGMTWKPGQHVYLRFPSISMLENHPFTIASLCEETFVTDKNGMSTRTPLLFLVKPRAGLTKRLSNVTQQRTSLKAFIDGPYGGTHLNLSRKYEQVILVAGGSGISALLPLLSVLCRNMNKVDSILESVRLIWVIKNQRAQAWVQDEIKKALEMTSPKSVSIDLFITGEKNGNEQLDFSFEADDIEMEAGLENRRRTLEEVDLEEQRLIPDSASVLDPEDGDLNEFVSLDDLELKLGMGGETSGRDVDGDDNENQKLVPGQRMNGQHQNQAQDYDYGIGACVSHGRPCFQDVLPRLLLDGGMICFVGKSSFRVFRVPSNFPLLNIFQVVVHRT